VLVPKLIEVAGSGIVFSGWGLVRGNPLVTVTVGGDNPGVPITNVLIQAKKLALRVRCRFCAFSETPP
jgi:hypothetical protein